MNRFLFFVAAAITVASCTTKVKAPGILQTEKVQFADSSRAFTCRIDMEFPRVQDEASKIIFKTLSDSMKTHLEEMGYLEEPVRFDSLDCTEIYNFYDSVANDDYNERKQYYEEAPGWEFDINLARIQETEKYIVFNSEDYVYYGGVHGGTIGLGALTFNKATGEIISTMIEPAMAEEMQPLLLKGLEAYFKSGDFELDSQELKEVLSLNNGLIPLPEQTPYPTAEGLVFTYQEYEIAWYAAGAPTFTVPYGEIERFLTKEAKEIL